MADKSGADPGVDVEQQLIFLMGDLGGLQNVMGAFRIKVYHTRAFPWDDVFKLLLYRDFKIDVTRHKADIYIEARP
jgi:hypothetical protein